MNHPTDRQLELWLRSKDKLGQSEAVSISDHLDSCQFCEERLDTLRAYYHDLESEINKTPGKKDKTIASKIFQRRTQKALSAGSLIQTYEAPLEEHRSPLPVRVKNYLQHHPVSSVSISIGTVFLAVLLFIVQPWKGFNNNPTYAEVERNVLQVYNQEGEPIWNRVIDGIPNGVTSETEETGTTNRLIRITDIDGDGTNEVLLTGEGNDGEFTEDTLYCYNSDGSLRWRQTPPHPISFGSLTHSSVLNWDIFDFFVLNQSGNNNRLFVASNSSWFPSVLFELSAADGEILQTYWHPGWIFGVETYKAAENENDRIILGATNNSYQRAALIVLNPDHIAGYAPLKEYYKPEAVSRAVEDHYILLKPSRLLELFGTQLYNETYRMRITDDGGLMVRARENLQISDKPVAVMYTLDNNFEVLEARGVARYQRVYSDLYNEGKLEDPLTDEYWESLRDSVLYWDKTTSDFVSQSQIED